MLVLSRKEGERLVIGDNITLVVSKINGNRVTIGIEAPKDVKIVRSELAGDIDATSVDDKSSARPVRASSSALKEIAGSILTLKRQVG